MIRHLPCCRGTLTRKWVCVQRRHFYATELMHLTAPGLLAGFALIILPRAVRLGRIKKAACRYLEQLLQTNTTRVVFDLEQRVQVSRRKRESELRFLLQQIANSATRALERARDRYHAGQHATAAELARIDTLRQRLNRVIGHGSG
jgi:hypothetical protein